MNLQKLCLKRIQIMGFQLVVSAYEIFQKIGYFESESAA